MSFISVMEAKLPPGFRFHPKDEELVCDYLAKKVAGNNTWSPFEYPMLVEVDLNKIEPWDLPEMACVGGKEWYFFSLRDRKYATGLRTNRATLSGYWKATGKDRRVVDVRKGALVGMRKTLVFYQGRAPKGRKTDWVMHEFRLEGQLDSHKISSKEDWVLCRVFYKNRGMSGKHSEENCYDDTGSSLPPLMDPYLTFDQAPLNLEGFEQVPCFSSLSQDQTSQQKSPTTFPADLSQVDTTIPIKSLVQPPAEAFPDNTALFPADQPFFCEKEVIKAVLDHLNKQAAESDGKPVEVVATPSLGEGTSANYFADLGFNTVWNHCMFSDLIN